MLSASSERARPYWDGAGIVLSGLCILHCLLLPLVAMMLPAFVWADDEHIHQALAVGLVIPAAMALWAGHRRHRHHWPLLLALSGLTLVATAAYADMPAWLEILSTVTGSVMLISAHRHNYSLCRHCPTCQKQGNDGTVVNQK